MATKAKAKKTTAKTNGKTRNLTQDIVAMLRRSKGVTRKEVLALTKWQAVSMQQIAEAGGVKLKMQKVKGQPIVYRAG